ncbi:MAG: M48 family metalloprotease [Gemmatimonadota bacterium]
MNSAFGRTHFGATAFLTVLAATSCAMNPVSGERELALISESQEIEMGRQGSSEVIATIGLVPDAALQSYVNRIGQEMAAGTERPQLAWEFHVLDDASVNAFAMPGGFIFVTRGLLSHMMNEAQLASVIGHEIGHVTARHSVQQMSRQQLASLGLGLGSVLSSTIAEYGQLASVGLGLLFLKYGRDDEIQADQLGFRYALADGYDTRQMAAVFEMLRRDAQLAGGGRLPEWQSSHPDPGNRIQDVQRMVAAAPEDFGAKKVAGDEYLRRLDGMIYGEDPRVGYFQGSMFIHPDLQFVLNFPDGWATQNATDAVTAISPNGDAIVQLRGATGSAAEAARSFLGQEGVQSNSPSTGSINGNRAVSAEFAAQISQQESVRGVVTFIEFRGATWGILGYSVADRFSTYSPAFLRTRDSFDRLTDPTALAAQPLRIRIDHAPRAMSLQQFNTERCASIPLVELAVINGLDETAQLRAGQAVKRVTGSPMGTGERSC